MVDWVELGYWGLFLISFLAATILPMGSEPVLAAMFYLGFDSFYLGLVASIGNTLGGMTSYGLGHLGKLSWIEKWLKVSHEKVLEWQHWVERYGSWLAALCWLPIVGDPIAIALGYFKVPWLRVLLLMAIGKSLRYFVLLYLME